MRLRLAIQATKIAGPIFAALQFRVQDKTVNILGIV
jgi:hypothetical protein